MADYNISRLLKRLKNNKDYYNLLKDYETQNGKLNDNYVEWKIYKDYLSLYKTFNYNIPDALQAEYDWDFFLRLSAASNKFSSDISLISPIELTLPELIITYKTGEIKNTKKVSSMIAAQIEFLFEEYLIEQIKDEFETKFINYYTLNLQEWNQKVIVLNSQIALSKILPSK